LGEEEGRRRGCLASYSPFFGVGAFAFLELPGSWDLRMGPEPPECDLLGGWDSTGSYRWVMEGKLKAFLVQEEKNRIYLLSVESRDVREASRAQRAIEKRMRKIEAKKASEVIGRGFLEVSGHRAAYMAFVERRGFLPRAKARYVLVTGFFCDETGRLLWVEVRGGPYLLEDLEDLVSIISSLSCHG